MDGRVRKRTRHRNVHTVTVLAPDASRTEAGESRVSTDTDTNSQGRKENGKTQAVETLQGGGESERVRWAARRKYTGHDAAIFFHDRG